MAKSNFPKISGKHNFAPLFTAEQVMKREPRIPKKVLFVYSTSLLEKIRKELSVDRYQHKLGKGGNWSPKSIMTRDKKLMIVPLPLGSPITATAMEEAIVCGGKEFLILGAAGALNQKLSTSDIVLCTKAIRDEGTSHHYLKTSKYVLPDAGLTSKLEIALRKKGVKFYKGTTWTIDAPYMETKEEIKLYKKEGVLTVEMEASALFAVAIKRKVKAAAVFSISDVLGEEWSGFVNYQKGYESLAQIARIFKDI